LCSEWRLCSAPAGFVVWLAGCLAERAEARSECLLPDEALGADLWRVDSPAAHETLGSPGQYGAKLDATKLAFVRICTHYFAHGAWLDDGQLLRDIHRLKGIPGVLIHGRLDLSGPLLTAWELAQAWPDAELTIIEDSGHTGSPAMGTAILDAIARFDPSRSHF
jgi:proline iminopeptidase